ncbi:MAG: AbrB/MazE/SpoVT family DNA-binding domain-containing protein [Patescibacteria group bacterium]|jgi:AbrB family looped-hinge helix DNA binding protein
MQTIPIEDIIMSQPKGVITLPKKIRDSVGIVERGLLRVRADGGKITIEPVRTLPYPVRTYTDKELAEFLALDQEEGKKLRRLKIIK